MSFIDELRKPKIPLTGGMVLFDWIMTILGALLITYTFHRPNLMIEEDLTAFLYSLMILIILSIVLHYLLDIPTVSNYYLGLSKNPREE